jgi:hypothetical protein
MSGLLKYLKYFSSYELVNSFKFYYNFDRRNFFKNCYGQVKDEWVLQDFYYGKLTIILHPALYHFTEI